MDANGHVNARSCKLPLESLTVYRFFFVSISTRNVSVLMSNDLQSTEPECKGINGQISQIPGLSPSITSLPEERARGRRAGVRESDSDYVKLAKQGGHKGLLWHENTTTSQPDAYKPPGWFSTASGDDGQPSLINSEEKKNPGAFQPREPPFGTDNMSAWERDDSSSSSNGKEKNNNVPDSQMVKLESSNQYHETSKFKRIVFDKNPAPVNMSKLLSFGYAEDNKPTANTDLSN